MPRPKAEGTYRVKELPQGENFVAMAFSAGILVYATNKAMYATGDKAKIKNLFPREAKEELNPPIPKPTPEPEEIIDVNP